MHFWLSTARLYGRVPVPRKTSLNWFMPALVNSSVGSSSGTTGDDGTIACCFDVKKSRNCWRTSFAVGMEDLGLAAGGRVDVPQRDVLFAGQPGAVVVL